jgi:pyridoxamine 5'-phosphate oxidase
VSDPAHLRRAYFRGQLTESGLAESWYPQVRSWFDAAAAAELVEPNAIQLATVSAEGRPSVRTVLAKGLDERGIVFYTGYTSAKAADLAVNPWAAAVFAWLAQERQVRLSGLVEKVTRDETEAYFASRPRGSQLGAWASSQSTVVASRAELEADMQAVDRRFGDGPIPAPPDWGGYRLRPELVEFWQGRADRLHDRLRYRLDGQRWVVERLAP